MKKYLFLILAMGLGHMIFGQSFMGMKIKKIGVVSTFDQDMITGINADYFKSISKDGIYEDLDDITFADQDIASMFCENPALRAELTLEPFRGLPNIQLNTAASLMFNRNDGSYYNFNFGQQQNSATYNNINFSSYSNEAAVDASLLYHHKFAFLHFYGGVGGNLGMTFQGKMNVSGNYTVTTIDENAAEDDAIMTESKYFQEQHDMKNIMHQRAFLHGAATVIFFKRLEVGVEGRLGKGFRFADGMTKGTTLNSFGFLAKWNLK